MIIALAAGPRQKAAWQVADVLDLAFYPGISSVEACGGLSGFFGDEGPWFSHVNALEGGRHRIKTCTPEGITVCHATDGRREVIAPERAIQWQCALQAQQISALTLAHCGPLSVPHTRWCCEWAQRSVAQISALVDAPELWLPLPWASDEGERVRAIDRIAELSCAGYIIPACALHASANEFAHATAKLTTDKPWLLAEMSLPWQSLPNSITHMAVASADTAAAKGQALRATHWQDVLQTVDDKTGPLAADCDCDTCTTYTQAYLQHLLQMHQPLAVRLIAEHNRYYVVCAVKAHEEKTREEEPHEGG